MSAANLTSRDAIPVIDSDLLRSLSRRLQHAVTFLQGICCGWNTGEASDFAAKSRRAVFSFFPPELCTGDLSIRLIASICCGVSVGQYARFSGQTRAEQEHGRRKCGADLSVGRLLDARRKCGGAGEWKMEIQESSIKAERN
jgi:hypothetical protein